MESRLMFLDCPAYLDRAGGERCGLAAEVRCRFIMRSVGGPLERAIPSGEPITAQHPGTGPGQPPGPMPTATEPGAPHAGR